MRLDYKTDAIIQESLRKELASETTVLTVAHRLQTIMDADRIVSSVHFSISSYLPLLPDGS